VKKPEPSATSGSLHALDSVGVVGAGGWGTALAVLLASKGVRVRLWGYEAPHVEEMVRTRENRPFLAGVALPDPIEPTNRLEALRECPLLIFVPPSKAARSVATALAGVGLPASCPVISCTKGIEHGTGLRMSEVLALQLPDNPIGVLSGPSHAEEVARGEPTAVVIGAPDLTLAQRAQELFATSTFRAYRTDDVAGIELGGALKNIYAIGAGICDGLGLGDNTKAALITRSLAEMIRLGVALGGRSETFQGLSGIGDLMVTCFSQHSRNRGVGERLGRGEPPAEILGSMRMVAEGVPTARSAFECARRLQIDTPVLDQVCAILDGTQPPANALRELMTRDLKAEGWSP